MFLGRFWILLKMSEILISSTGNQKQIVLFLRVFCDTRFFLEIFTTHLTMQCFKCLFNMNDHIDQVGCVTFVETFEEEKNIGNYCVAPGGRYQDIRHLL